MASVDKVKVIAKKLEPGKRCLAICAGKHCAKAGAKHIIHAARAAVSEQNLDGQVKVVLTKCQDHCDDAPALTVLPGKLAYVQLQPDDLPRIVRKHLVKGKPVTALLTRRSRKRLKRKKLRENTINVSP